MSTYIPVELRRQVIALDRGLCAYCQSAERLMGISFEIDHIVPLAAGGDTTLDNLCLSCPNCNRYKAFRITYDDPQTGQEIAFFHSRQQAWREHFVWSADGQWLHGLTPTGRATVEAFRMNRPAMVSLRAYWVILELHPP
jgi:hypothetical protein